MPETINNKNSEIKTNNILFSLFLTKVMKNPPQELVTTLIELVSQDYFISCM